MENMENAARKKVMLSGIQPSGDLTLGSYLGAIKNWAERDEEFDNYYFMADMHSITVRQDPAALRRLISISSIQDQASILTARSELRSLFKRSRTNIQNPILSQSLLSSCRPPKTSD